MQNVKNPVVRMKQEPSKYLDATSEILQNSVCTCSDCGTAFCVSKRDHDTNQCVKCKRCDAAVKAPQKSFTNPVQVIGSRTKGHEYSEKVTRIDKDTMEATNEPKCEKSYKSVSGVNVNFPKNSDSPSVQLSKSDEIDDSPQNLSTTTAQLSAQIMNLSYREFKESISQDQPEKVTYSTNVILKRIKEAYDACSCKICECLTGQSVLPRIENCGSSPCHCEPCNCKDCQDFFNRNKDLLDIGNNPRLHCIQKTNTATEQIKRGFSNLDNQHYSCNPCSCEPCRCKDCTKDFLNFKNDPLIRYTTKTGTVLERLRNGYNNLNDNPTSEYSACNCEPCECKDCQRDRLNFSIDALLKSKKRTGTETQQINGDFLNSTNCNCKPCDCIKCAKSYASPCDCKPCECYDCKSARGLGKKTVIVAPVEEGPQQADCVCSPCDCARCAHRGVDMYPNRVHEMSTGINRHPNCHCEACANDACEPNGTGSCRCEGRHGVISKPVDNNPHDFDIRRASVSSKPLKTLGNRFVGNTFVAMNMNKFPSGTGFERQRCKCSVCECIVCKCKKNVLSQSKSSQNVDDSLRTLKLPSRELKSCQCEHCECQYCALKKQGNLVESVELKRCTCDKCDCIHCEGELKPRHTLSKLIPVVDGSKDACRCKPCECIDCKKMEAQRLETSHEALYPIKKGEILTPSIIRKDPPLSEPELLRQSSEYTQIKHSMAQSNVFNASKLPERSQQNFSIYHMYPENNLNKKFNYRVATTAAEQDSQKMKSRSVKIFDPIKENRLYRNNCPSTFRAVPRREISMIRINTILNHQHNYGNEQNFESPFFEDMVPISKISRTPSILSMPQSARNLVNLSPTVSYGETSDLLSIPSPKWNSKINIKSHHDQKENNDEKDLTKLKQSRCHLCGSISTKSEIITCDGITQTSLNFTYYSGDNSDFECPVLKYSDHSKELRPFSSEKYEIGSDNDGKYGLKKEYFTWRVENLNACSYGGSDEDHLFDDKSAHYERALKTLKRAKEFSFELVTLLQQYDKANQEFVSVTKKLKESHELILNDFKNYVCGRVGGSDDVNYLTRSSLLSNNEHRLIDANQKKSSNDWKELKEIKKHRLDTMSLTASVINSLSGQRIYMIENQSSDQFDNHFTTEHHNKESDVNLTPKVDNKTELNVKEVTSRPSEYKAYEKLVKRSANHLRELNEKNSLTAKNQKDNMRDVMSTSVSTMIEVDLLKSFIRQEVHNVLKELNVNYSSGENITNLEVLEKEKPAVIKHKELTPTTLDNKPSVKGKRSIIYANQHEAMVVSKSPSPMQKSSSHRRHLALKKLQNEVQELINETRVHSTSARRVLSSSKVTDQRSQGELDAEPSPGISKADVKKSIATAKKVKCLYCEGLKVSLEGLRRVSDHTVIVKWRAPRVANDVKGFEVLVDGKPIDKQFRPSDRMAVVTCLPQARVALAVRAVPRRAPACHHRQAATLLYRPREK